MALKHSMQTGMVGFSLDFFYGNLVSCHFVYGKVLCDIGMQ